MNAIETYYLIDYENVHGSGLSGCQDLTAADHIVIFFTTNAKTIDMREISNHGDAKLEMIEVPAGKQSADMHIGSYLGFLAGSKQGDCSVVIVSRDTDYDKVIKFWQMKTGIKAYRTVQIKEPPAPKQLPVPKSSRSKQPRSGRQSQGTKSRNSGKPQNTKPEGAGKPEERREPKASKKNEGDMRSRFNQEMIQAIRDEGYDSSVEDTVAQIAAGIFGEDRMLEHAHNALQEKYTDYLEVYRTVKPVLVKYADEPVKSKTAPVSSGDKDTANTEIMRILSKAGFANDIATSVASTVVKNLGVKSGKQQTYRSIISKYGKKQGLQIYNHIRNHL